MPGSSDKGTEGPACRLYLITPPSFDLAAFSGQLAETLGGGDVACLQLRLKGPDGESADDADIRAAVETLMPIAHQHEVAFILNDRPDLAAELGCDGVHVGREDGDYKSARATVGPDAIVGTTCHNSRHLAMEDAEAGADYVAFGAFFPTSTKQVQHQAEIETLEIWSETMEVPSVAIGGITAENCAPLVQAGADFLAVIGAVWNHPDGPADGVKAMNDAIAAAADV
ncbi:thiamine phosphate synthase [Hwanghaeella grinnelliae]|uniref:Thiamine-phosphate synthase n=1 Tax=Hwanghaeella grinnelliae TaxID=2500179 RepID=A0A3S2VM73_9PROT|nr:thiamine phosphate synthase [Hwanghaeella grinnelliae]RVU33762.1 thiamine phosphate synthase [Hwanghaeella grinnelliae]